MFDSIPISYYILSGIFNFITTTALAVFVFSKDPKSGINQTFCLFALTVAGWSLFYYLWLTADNSDLAEVYLRTLMLFVIFIPATFTHFILTLLRSDRKGGIIITNYLIS